MKVQKKHGKIPKIWTNLEKSHFVLLTQGKTLRESQNTALRTSHGCQMCQIELSKSTENKKVA